MLCTQVQALCLQAALQQLAVLLLPDSLHLLPMSREAFRTRLLHGLQCGQVLGV